VLGRGREPATQLGDDQLVLGVDDTMM